MESARVAKGSWFRIVSRGDRYYRVGSRVRGYAGVVRCDVYYRGEVFPARTPEQFTISFLATSNEVEWLRKGEK